MKNIFVPLDLRSDHQALVNEATLLAQAFGSTLWLEHVAAPEPEFAGYEAGPKYIRDMRADELREEHHELLRIIKEITAKGIEAHALLIHGPTAETIIKEADRLQADLVVMGTHGRRGLAKAFMGSVSDEVLRANRFKVLVIPTALDH
ncbi:MAG: universal stress protein [Flavobacteriales bacterium]